MKTLIGPFKQIITMDHLSLRGPLSDEDLHIIPNGGVLIEDELISKIDHFDTLYREYQNKNEFNPVVLEDNCICMPGFIDAHTHLCYGGSRVADYTSRISGKTYEQISQEGGGIWHTVQNTRSASKSELADTLQQRVSKHSLQGITTIEIKSGYGLNVDDELKILEVINEVHDEQAIDLIPTCLAAHTLPNDFYGGKTQYLEFLLDSLIPNLHRSGLTNRIDAFIDDLAFSPNEASQYLYKCKELGFDLTIHGDQFSVGGSRLAVDLDAKSVDHLECINDADIRYLAQSQTTGIILPGASLGLGMPFAPARKLLDAGCKVGIASDTNPGSAPMGNLLIQASLLSAYEKLTNAEVFAGITFRAGETLRLLDRGKLKLGYLADLAIFPTDDYREISYNQGTMLPMSVWKRGLRMF